MNSTNQKTDINISGMTCSRCANSVKRAISELEGVQDVSVNLEGQSASVQYDSGKLSSDDFKNAVEAAGYSLVEMK